MPDQGCSKTRAQGGCTKRRCAKSNTYNKICDKDNKAPTGSCSVDQCELKCKDHTAFKCTHWAHDIKDNECYLFAGCLDEGDDGDYNLFKMATNTTTTPLTLAPAPAPAPGSPADQVLAPAPVPSSAAPRSLLSFYALLLAALVGALAVL